MDSAIRRLRSAAQQLAHGKAPRAIRYPAPFRAAAVRVARTHRERGRAGADLAYELGLTGSVKVRMAISSRSHPPGHVRGPPAGGSWRAPGPATARGWSDGRIGSGQELLGQELLAGCGKTEV
jgi:hypothetical protein